MQAFEGLERVDHEAPRRGRHDGEAAIGEEVQQVVSKMFALPASVVERTKQALIYKAPK